MLYGEYSTIGVTTAARFTEGRGDRMKRTLSKRLADGDFIRTCHTRQNIDDSLLRDMDEHPWYVLFLAFSPDALVSIRSSQIGSRRHFAKHTDRLYTR